MLMPKKVKHRKHQKGKSQGKIAKKGTSLDFGMYGLKAMEASWISSRQIEAARRAMTRYTGRAGKIWIRIFPAKPVTRKGAEVGMGSGKGSVDHFVVPVKPGRILFEMDGVSFEIAKEAIHRAKHKLPIKTKFVSR